MHQPDSRRSVYQRVTPASGEMLETLLVTWAKDTFFFFFFLLSGPDPDQF